MQISEEEFAEWQQHPVTEWVMAAMRREAAAKKQEWADIAWDKGHVDTPTLTEARVLAESYLAIPDTQYEVWSSLNDSDA